MAEDPVEEGLRLIQSRPEGILQSELWKELGVDSRKCSRIVKKLEESGLIERVEFKKEGIKTYLLRARQQPVNPCNLLAGDELIPCIGCELECVVEECHPLMDWMYSSPSSSTLTKNSRSSSFCGVHWCRHKNSLNNYLSLNHPPLSKVNAAV